MLRSNEAIEQNPEFRAELVKLNLTRLWWFQIVTIGVLLVMVVATALDPVLSEAGISHRGIFDLVGSIIAFGVCTLARRQPPTSIWPKRIVLYALILLLAGLQSWYFLLLPVFGQNTDYVIGVFIAGALFLIPPRTIWFWLAVNHLVYCSLLVTLPIPSIIVAPALIDGTFAVLIAALVSRILYRNKVSDFQQRQVILATNAELREVMTIAAHDLCSPLLGARDLVYLGQRPSTSPERCKQIFASVAKTCTDLVELVERMVAAHAAEHGADYRILESSDLRIPLRESVDRLKVAAEAKHIRVVFEQPETSAISKINPEALTQAVDNLISNALKYSRAQSTIGVKLFKLNRTWTIDVWDEGPGIPVEERAHLFKKFYRGSTRPTSGETSTGLGLFIVKTLVETMEGTVEYLPRKPAGSIFRIQPCP